MSESHYSVKSIEYDRRVNHLVIVELSKVSDLCNTSLVELKIVLFQTKSDVLK